VKKEAKTLGVEVTGSELVGLSPLEAMLMAGRSFGPQSHDEKELLLIAEEKLGLSQLDKFDPRKKIIEYQL
jgi:glutamate formiminotransferase/formiminotetrahydrofolate cyclodeaminase